MMAGILFQFGLSVFKATASMPEIALSMIVVYLLARRFFARYAVLLVLLRGCCCPGRWGRRSSRA